MGATMTDVYIVALTIIGILISYPGLMAAINLLLPQATSTAYHRVAETPGKTFFMGLLLTAILAFWILILSQVGSGALRSIAAIFGILTLGFSAVGAGGLVRLLGDRIGYLTGTAAEMKNLIRGAVIYELACFTPIVGWFLFLPVMSIMAMGASLFGILGWMPRIKQIEGNDEEEILIAQRLGMDLD